MQYAVVTVATRRQLKNFLALPERVYRGDPHWIAPLRPLVRHALDPRKNPYFAHASLRLFLCYRQGIASGRLAVVIDREQEKREGARIAFFGFFEALEDAEIARRLFGEAERYARAEGAVALEGPYNPNHYSEVGLQASHFEADPVFFQPHNPPYYAGLLAEAGYGVSMKLHTRCNPDLRAWLCGRGDGGSSPPREGYTIRSFDMRHMERDLEAVRSVFNDAFAGNWRFVPVSREEYLFASSSLRLVTAPDLVKIVEYRGVPVGVLQCVLDVNPILKRLKGRIRLTELLLYPIRKRSIDRVIVFAVGIRKAHRCSAVIRMLHEAFAEIAHRYRAAEATWMYDDNRIAIREAEHSGMKKEKEYLIFRKELGQETPAAEGESRTDGNVTESRQFCDIEAPAENYVSIA